MPLLDATAVSDIVLTKTSPDEILKRFGSDLDREKQAGKTIEAIEDKPTFHWFFFGIVVRGFAAIIDRGKNHKLLGRVWVHPHYRSEDIGRTHCSALLQETVRTMPGEEMTVSLIVWKNAPVYEYHLRNGWRVVHEHKGGSVELRRIWRRKDNELREVKGPEGQLVVPATGYLEPGDMDLKYVVRNR